MALLPIKSLSDAEVSPGDVIRWGQGARWAIVCEVDSDTPQGALYRLRWTFGADAGEWVQSEAGSIEGWHRADQNKHALYRRTLRHSAKDRRNARTDIHAALGGVEARRILGES